MDQSRRNGVWRRWWFTAVCLLTIAGLGVPSKAPADAKPESHALLLHLPGIAGTRRIDHAFTMGIEQGGFDGVTRIYDWTGPQPGLQALVAYEQNHAEAVKIAKIIQDYHRRFPREPIYLTSHSGGTGLAAWALEDLPPDVKVTDVAMLASALSPNYDLTRALQHVTGRLYVFSSLADVFVLGAGTQLFGTIDGVKTEAAGKVGFRMPPGADAKEYQKLVALPYDPSWTQYGNMGDHIGPMTRTFSRQIVAPLILHGIMPPTTLPATAPTPSGLGRKLPGADALK